MEIDQTSFNDLAIFSHNEEFSVFEKLDFTETLEGREWLQRYFKHPFSDYAKILETQQTVRQIYNNLDAWPTSISNGTIMVLVKFYDSNIDTMPRGSDAINAGMYKLLHAADFSLVRYTLEHFADFLRGMKETIQLLRSDDSPKELRSFISRSEQILAAAPTKELSEMLKGKSFSMSETVHYGRFVMEHFRNHCFELINIYGRIDAWHSMAKAMKHYQLVFPEFIQDEAAPFIHAEGLYHILLSAAVPYDVAMNKKANFYFLTGANMAGKSTFIKAVGTAVFLAHLGMGVPASSMRLSIFDGLLSNINVVDNIVKGESYFFNEVQRIRNTIIKINDGRKWLVLIDELFKGTNVQDAMKCSSTVIRGLIKISSSLFILSTHLYEIGEELKQFNNIRFRYFETSVDDDQLVFSYQLKEGISNDRIGYLILKREKVVDLLEQL
jgi:DNA mismatch repair protein MutS